jgi:cell division septation protein DedD
MQSAGTLFQTSRETSAQNHSKNHASKLRRTGSKRLAFLLASAAMLSACEEGTNFFATAPQDAQGTEIPAQQQTSTKIVERDVEAPDVFQVTADGLWDGRPSLGGVWVAHVDVTDPERVIIRNSSNGKFVIGALFKRERSAPGPDIQVSSDAAEALGMLAGSPAALNVTALRREEVQEAIAAPQVDVIEAPEAIEAVSLDPIADAAATLDAIAAPVAPIAKPAPPKPVAAPKPTASSLDKPLIQVGIFSVKANADRNISMLGSQGVDAAVKQGESAGKAFWRVVVGPASTSSERNKLLEKVKAAGFTDAYFVTH